jgi:NADH dehydrogenase
MGKTVFVTGATGFVGHEVVRQLTAAGHTARCLIRPGSERKLETLPRIEVVYGDVIDPDSLKGLLEGCTAVIHLVGIIREFPRRAITFERLHVDATVNMLTAATEQGVKRYLHMSANGACTTASAGYLSTKGRAEEQVCASTLDWTIFRPSLIFGPGGEFVQLLSDLVRRLPIVPVIGNGRYRMQPVAVEQVAESFVGALQRPETCGQTYHLGGGQSYTYDELLDLVGQALGKRHVAKLHQPLFMMRTATALLESIPLWPVSSDQIDMLLAGNVCNPADWATAFDLTPITFAQGIERCIKS